MRMPALTGRGRYLRRLLLVLEGEGTGTKKLEEGQRTILALELVVALLLLVELAVGQGLMGLLGMGSLDLLAVEGVEARTAVVERDEPIRLRARMKGRRRRRTRIV